ncbi:response regulator [Pseudokordiimonas caeni]|uniref:response regulator n=1 Tax=Pseudokordiimonas caeni TaxID=2997908 RepID=UPI002810D1D4|nr:response regulator [Pseudokordiimonas caeni]
MRQYLVGKSALIAFSNRQLAKLVRDFLRSNGVEYCAIAETSQAAVSLTEARPVDLFFVDYDLEPIGGIFFVKFLRMQPTAVAEAPCVMVIPSPSKEKVWEARDAGVNEILGLPLTAELLKSRLSKIYTEPRPFIRASTYIGPCRRIRQVQIYHGQERRKQKGGK